MIIRTLVVLACGYSPERGAYIVDCVPVVSPIAAPTTCAERFAEIKLVLPANMKLTFPECLRVWR